jgi:hypothetical protein
MNRWRVLRPGTNRTNEAVIMCETLQTARDQFPGDEAATGSFLVAVTGSSGVVILCSASPLSVRGSGGGGQAACSSRHRAFRLGMEPASAGCSRRPLIGADRPHCLFE